MCKNPETISVEKARSEVVLAVRRLALLHLAFCQTLVENLGDERGRTLIVKAIRRYGEWNGTEARKAAVERGAPLTPENYFGGKNDFPSIGMHDRTEYVTVDGERRARGYGCTLAKVWREYGDSALGRLYCLVDPAQVMTYNPEIKFVHTKAVPDGDVYCELAFRATTQEEKDAWIQDDGWEQMDLPR
jgi:hypothetical protein